MRVSHMFIPLSFIEKAENTNLSNSWIIPRFMYHRYSRFAANFTLDFLFCMNFSYMEA